jgi:hypothetical protein
LQRYSLDPLRRGPEALAWDRAGPIQGAELKSLKLALDPVAAVAARGNHGRSDDPSEFEEFFRIDLAAFGVALESGDVQAVAGGDFLFAGRKARPRCSLLGHQQQRAGCTRAFGPGEKRD